VATLLWILAVILIIAGVTAGNRYDVIDGFNVPRRDRRRCHDGVLRQFVGG
jgi:hypothetical protein